jgi:hypothetical protein
LTKVNARNWTVLKIIVSMDQKLKNHIVNCFEQASRAKEQADRIPDRGLRLDLLNLERSWLCLAQSYIHSERIEQFLLAHGKTGQLEWRPSSGAPFDRDLEIAVIDNDGPHAFAFPCRRVLNGWIDAETKKRLDVRPTHWREWKSTTG